MKKPKTRNAFTMTEAAFKGAIINLLRRARFWKPPNLVKNKHRRKNQSNNTKLKYEYQCNHCKKWYPDKEVQVDHIEPVVATTGFVDYNTYIERLFVEEEGYQVLCLECHKTKSKKENELR